MKFFHVKKMMPEQFNRMFREHLLCTDWVMILLLLKYRDVISNSRQPLTFRLQPCVTR